ncbi:MAG: hypothetical protein JOZ54_18045 [Acidobacteria bacterium]|nr:hypothetical protein [Acidobacteriota bacterium]
MLKLAALTLIGSGAFALFQAATGQFLPHDTDFLGITARELCSLHGCRVVHFMIHDRVSFGGVLIAIGVMYLWLTEFPLRRGESWAWWAIAASGTAGFLSFLTYLGYGYLDTWHGAATLGILPLFAAGLFATRRLRRESVRPLPLDFRTQAGIARLLLLGATVGIMAAGLTIMTVGMTAVFVPTDLTFMRTTATELRAFNPHLVPLIAHDRAGFGGALVSCGIAMFLAVLFGRPSRNLTQALIAAGVAGFFCAIGVHPLIGYTDAFHLAPAVVGCIVFAAGISLTRHEVRTS